MIYIFESGDSISIVYRGDVLTEEQKARAIVVESLPEKDTPEGKIAILKADKSNNDVWWEYVDKPKSEVDLLDEKIDNAIIELTTLIAMGGM